MTTDVQKVILNRRFSEFTKKDLIAESLKEYITAPVTRKNEMLRLVSKYPLDKHTKLTYSCPITGTLRLKQDLQDDLQV